MANKFAVAEFADGNTQLIESWANAVQHRSAAFDFPLHFALKDMCTNPESFNMASLDHAGLSGIDPQGAVLVPCRAWTARARSPEPMSPDQDSFRPTGVEFTTRSPVKCRTRNAGRQ